MASTAPYCPQDEKVPDSSEKATKTKDVVSLLPYSDWKSVLKSDMESKVNYDSLDEESRMLVTHTCQEWSIMKVNDKVIGVKFNPSPHLFDENGKIKEEKKEGELDRHGRHSRRPKFLRYRPLMEEEDEYAPKSKTLEKACSLVAGVMECDQVEAAFMDHNEDQFKDVQVLQGSYGLNLQNGFVQACETAWAKHVPVRISCTHIWLLILQAVALHVDAHSEELRDRWVNFDGKKKLFVDRDNFVKGMSFFVFGFWFYFFLF